MNHSVWTLGPDAAAEAEGFETPAKNEVRDGVDYASLIFDFKRKPKFFFDQVIIPCSLFLLVAYMQFWVDRKVAPARAFLAVIPVLIMRTLSNNVYRSLPEGGQRMWLADVLTTFTVWTISGALHLGLVEALLLKEKGREMKRKGLEAGEKFALEMIKTALDAKMTLLDLVKKCKATPMTVQELPDHARKPLNSNQEDAVKIMSTTAKEHNVEEHDMLFIYYAMDIFNMFDKNGSGALSASEIRHANTHFNIYLSTAHTTKIVCMFLRDQGFTTPKDETAAELQFWQFCQLLIDMDKYLLAEPSFSLRDMWESSSPSERADMLARVIIIVGTIICIVAFYAALPSYKEG